MKSVLITIVVTFSWGSFADECYEYKRSDSFSVLSQEFIDVKSEDPVQGKGCALSISTTETDSVMVAPLLEACNFGQGIRCAYAVESDSKSRLIFCGS